MKRASIIKIVIPLCLFACSTNLLAQASENPYREIKHHVIVLIDKSGSMARRQASKKEFETKINAFNALLTESLPLVCFEEGRIFAGRKLLDQQKGDYLSILTFGLAREKPDFNNFIESIQFDNRNLLLMQNYPEQMFASLRDAINQKVNWDNRMEKQFFEKYWSAITVAPSMALSYLKSQTDQFQIHRTFLILISDYEYNISEEDNLLTAELDHLKKQIKNLGNRELAESTKKRFNKEFTMERKRIIGDEATVHLEVFELFPNEERSLRFDDIIIPTTAMFKAVPQGYALDFQMTPKTSEKYGILAIEAIIIDQETKAPIRPPWIFPKVTAPVTLDYIVAQTDAKRKFALNLQCWVHLKDPDSVYGAQILYPERTQGLNYTISEIPFVKSQPLPIVNKTLVMIALVLGLGVATILTLSVKTWWQKRQEERERKRMLELDW